MQKLETDIAANGGTRIKLINEMAHELTEEGHSHSHQIRRRQKEVNDIWNALLQRKKAKAEELETAERVHAFNEMCEETRNWMMDKFDLLDQAAEAKDLKALQALQKRHQNLERELNPVDAKMKSLRELADQVWSIFDSLLINFIGGFCRSNALTPLKPAPSRTSMASC